MSSAELAHLELLAEIDALVADLRAWADQAPTWPAARACQALVRRLIERANALRVRLEAPLVVATLGGTGTGKSSLVNAIVGEEITPAGRERPTTRKPVLICRPDLSPELLGIHAESVHVIRRDLPALRDLVLLDCPDPDTTEEEAPGTNLARLRELLPHCDVLLVTATQQKYRSACVSGELTAAAPGARLVFVQTHADVDEDIRADWRRQLEDEFQTGDTFYVDSLAALSDAKAGLAPRGEFARLLDLLTHELAGAAAHRIRRANFLDLVEQTLEVCGEKLAAALPALERLEQALVEQRMELCRHLAGRFRADLQSNRRHWENRLLAEVCSRWGMSPFSLVLRSFQGLGALLANATLVRVRTPAQLAIWGVLEGGRRMRSRRERRAAESKASAGAAWGWDESQLRSSSLIVAGYAEEAGLPKEALQRHELEEEARRCGEQFVGMAARDVQQMIGRLARRHTGWFTRGRYELALLVVAGLLLYRLAKNFFYDNWLGPDFFGRPPSGTGLFGMEYFLQAGFWLLLWCIILVWLFTGRLRRGIGAAIDELAQRWTSPEAAGELFGGLDEQVEAAQRFSSERERLANATAAVRKQLEVPVPRLGRQRAEVRDQGSEGRDQRAEIRGQRSGIRGQGPASDL